MAQEAAAAAQKQVPALEVLQQGAAQGTAGLAAKVEALAAGRASAQQAQQALDGQLAKLAAAAVEARADLAAAAQRIEQQRWAVVFRSQWGATLGMLH